MENVMPPRSPSSVKLVTSISAVVDPTRFSMQEELDRGPVSEQWRDRQRMKPRPMDEQSECPVSPPPPLSTKDKDQHLDKKASPVSAAVHLELQNEHLHHEEMKISIDEDECVHVVGPPPLMSGEKGYISIDGRFHSSIGVKEERQTPPKPPLRPKPNRLLRSASDPSVHVDSEQGVTGMMHLANDCFASKDFDTALSLYKTLYRELKKKYGRSHPQVAICIHKIGASHLQSGSFDRSMDYLKTAVSLNRTLYGDESLDVATSMELLAAAKLHCNQVEDAHSIYRRALRIKRGRLGLYHEDVAHIQTQLACMYYYAGEVLAAQASFEEALDIYQHLQQFNPTNQTLWVCKAADTLCSIGSIKLAQHKYSRAVAFFSEALKSQKRLYGLYHHIVITTLDNLGYSYSKGKDYVFAAEVYEEMLHAQNLVGYTSECFTTLKKLTLIYSKLGKHYAAYEATMEAISFLENQYAREDDELLMKTKKLLEGIKEKIALFQKRNAATLLREVD